MGTGKKQTRIPELPLSRKHPRGDGEEHLEQAMIEQERETPPWGRGRTTGVPGCGKTYGNTPVGTGKNEELKYDLFAKQKHPRGDGEETKGVNCRGNTEETPPWGRGRKVPSYKRMCVCRNTPVGTGKKEKQNALATRIWKHPRGDGEEYSGTFLKLLLVETPPWGRGRKSNHRGRHEGGGNTPVGTGKNTPSRYAGLSVWKHPRGDGEEDEFESGMPVYEETPPWGRGRIRTWLKSTFERRNTPVGTGKNDHDFRLDER